MSPQVIFIFPPPRADVHASKLLLLAAAAAALFYLFIYLLLLFVCLKSVFRPTGNREILKK